MSTVDRSVGSLRTHPLFAAAPSDALRAIEESALVLALDAGDWLFREGDAPEALFLVDSGRLRVVAGTRTIRIVGPGALLGELGVLTGSPRSASVQALRDSRVSVLDARRFEELVGADAGFAAGLARELARLLQQSGGLLPPAAPAAVFTLVVPAARPSLAAVARRIAAAFVALAPTAVVEAPAAGTDHGALLEAAESSHRFVLLLVDANRADDWNAFALRQADRLLVFTDGTAAEGSLPDLARPALVVAVGDGAGAALAPWLDGAEVPGHHVLGPGGDGADRLARRLTGRALGVVLSGGGARGFAHIGALAALREAGFEIDRIGGCSIGSLIGAMAALGWPEERMVEVCEAELVRRAPFSDYTIPRVSLIRARRAAAMLQRVFGETLVEELQRPFFTVSADLLASELVVHRRGPIFEAVGASMSIPGLAPPVPVGARLLVDGGVLNNLPVDLMDAGEGPVVAIDVVRRMAPAAGGRPRLPSIMETLSRATVLGSVERSERNRRLATLTIAPEVQDVGLREFSRLSHAVEAGRRAAEETLAAGGAERLQAALAG